MSRRIRQETIDKILSEIDIVDLIQREINLNWDGVSRNCYCLCPFHCEKTPSFCVITDKQFYYCFGCGSAGNAITFLMHYHHLSFVRAMRKLSNITGIKLK